MISCRSLRSTTLIRRRQKTGAAAFSTFLQKFLQRSEKSIPEFRANMASSSSSSSSDGENLKTDLVGTFLNLEKLDRNLFRSTQLMPGLPTSQRVYGGQVIGQSLVAAGKTVPPEYHVHSLHCYFIKGGDKNMPIVYHIDPVRDGNSFATRFVKAVQDGDAIFSCMLSFHKEEPTSIEHQKKMPIVPKPEDLPDAYTVIKQAASSPNLSEERRKQLNDRLRMLPTTFELRPTDAEAFLRIKTGKPHYYLWVKSKIPVGDEIRLHHCVAAFISDSSMVGTALLPHLAAGFRLGMAVSLDHSMWFHRYRFSIDDWMLYETESTIATGGRAMIYGYLWTKDGVLALSTAQEALIRAKMGPTASSAVPSPGVQIDSGRSKSPGPGSGSPSIPSSNQNASPGTSRVSSAPGSPIAFNRVI